MKELQVFTYKNETVRTVQKDGETWWVLKDVCGVLGIEQAARVAERLDTDEKAEVSLTHSSSNGTSQNRNTLIINESGLYSVILRSDKPEAEAFRRWVTQEEDKK